MSPIVRPTYSKASFVTCVAVWLFIAACPSGRTGALSDKGSVRLGPMLAKFSGSSERAAMFSATSVAASGPLITPARVDAVGD